MALQQTAEHLRMTLDPDALFVPERMIQNQENARIAVEHLHQFAETMHQRIGCK